MSDPVPPTVKGRPTSATLRHSSRTFWKVFGAASKAAAAVHIAFGALFAALGLWTMVGVNAASVLIYVVALSLLRKRRNSVVVALVGCEIVLHAVIAARLLGLDSGFHYYLLVMLPLIIVGPGRTYRQKIALSAGLLAIDLLLDLAMHRIAPTYAVPGAALDALRLFNLTATFLLLGLLAQFYYVAVMDAESRLRAIASTDPLTGALNRRSLLELADRLIAENASLSIVLGDLDHFKAVNDVYGHECGDHVLVEIHRALRAAVRPDDEVARWGGEEFVTLLPRTCAADAAAIAERERKSVAVMKIAVGGGAPTTVRLTMTFGVATLLPDETPQACIARADAALYLGKAAGRDRVTSAT